MSRKLSVEAEERRQKDYAEGLKDQDLAERWGVGKAAVCIWRSKNGLKSHGKRGGGKRGPHKHFSCILWGAAFKGKFDPNVKVSGTDTEARQVIIAKSNSKDLKQAKRRGWSIVRVRQVLTALNNEEGKA